MGQVYILTKNRKYIHTYSKMKGDKLIVKGWKPIIQIDGWNISVTINEEVKFK